MRRFSSYGPIDKEIHFHVPRKSLVQKACTELIGENPEKGGHYITVWAPRQRGKTWIMIEALCQLMKDERFQVVKLDLEHLKMQDDPALVVKAVTTHLKEELNLTIPVDSPDDFHTIFLKKNLKKPLILIIDEFDALNEKAISWMAGVFRNIYNIRRKNLTTPTHEKEYLLHSVALIGVRSVLGVENVKGSPFNVQRGLHIPNLSLAEVESMFLWYEQESGHKIEQDVVERIFHETFGQPGLVSWFGELLTEGFEYFKPDFSRSLNMNDFENVYDAAIQVLPNNNIMNIISKARQQPYRNLVLELFKTQEKIPFKFDETSFNFLYTNGVIDVEQDNGFFARFSCSFVRKRLFNYFSSELFSYLGQIFDPFEDLTDTITEKNLNIKNLIRRYERHLQKNRDWMLEDAPRRKDLRIFEAVFHQSFVQSKDFQPKPYRNSPDLSIFLSLR
ncbi:AAA-like domain-containing protein [Desulfobacterales bacterium HSG16]|nr:AAA-like domain-containing protein [Desulfobacterales bacterium HSG16]